MTPLHDKDLRRRIDGLAQRHAVHDRTAVEMYFIRTGQWDKVAPGSLNKDHPKPIVANRVDTFAKHAAAALAPLPTVRCQSPSVGASKAEKDRAEARTKVVNHYLERSNLEYQMQAAGDGFYMYGLIVASVVPDFTDKMPNIMLRDPFKWYPVWDWRGNTVEVAHIFTQHVADLIQQYPESERILREYSTDKTGSVVNPEVDVYYHDDGTNVTIMVPQCGGLVVNRFANPIGKCLTHVGWLPSSDGQIHGALDGLGWVQIAANEMQLATLEAAFDAIEAPYVVPLDVGEVAIGPGSVIRTNNPQGAGRLNMNVPQGAFAAVQHFKEEMQTGSLVPEAMGGNIDASVVTGKGVQQLMAGYSQQIAFRQGALVSWFKRVLALALELDETLWPNERKTMTGTREGNQYSEGYTPAKDIAGRYDVDVNYGSALGLDPNRTLVYELQLYGAGMHSKDTALRQLPGSINAADELRKIQVEQSRDALMASITSLPNAIPGMSAQGQNPAELVAKVALFTNLLEKGEALEDIAVKVFPMPEPEPQAPQQMTPDDMALAQMQQAMGGGGAPGAGGNMEEQEAAALPGQDLASRPGMSNLFAGLTSGGQPNLGAYVQRQSAAG
jgi:hypothetical protein